MKMPYRKIMLEHSEDFPDGKTIVMNMGDLPKNINGLAIKVLLFDVQFETETDFVVIAGIDSINEYPGGIKSLNRNEKKLCVERLFSKGISWDV